MNATRTISVTGLRKLQDIWLRDWQEHGDRYDGGNAERWFNAVLDFLEARGDEIIPRELRDQEIRLINIGRSQEYLSALADLVIEASPSPSLNDYDKTVLVLTATPEERAEALEKVLNHEAN